MRRLFTLLLLAAPLAAQGQNPRERLDETMRIQMVRLMRVQVGLTDAQVARVQDVRTKYETQLRQLNLQEGKLRNDLRDEVTVGDSTRNPQVRDMLDRMMRIQRQKADIAEGEYKDLAAIMSPMQHAKYIGLQEVLRRRINQMLQAAADSSAPVGGRAARPGNGRRVPPL